jgi:phosphatidylserine decarboxylase
MGFSLRERVTLKLLAVVPQNELSRAVGWVLSRPVPRVLREPIYGTFAARFGVNVSEAEQPLSSYPTFDEFFTRKLKDGVRSMASSAIVSPVDGVVSQFGDITEGRLLQAKGKTYQVGDLLGEEQAARDFLGGQFLTIYLSPKDYHRIHSPVDGAVEKYIYVPGRLWPVNPPAVASIEGLFTQNERISSILSCPSGKAAVVKVGATCVGSISLTYDTLRSNRANAQPAIRSLVEPLPVSRLSELGAFHMGSTVILLFSPSMPKLANLQEGQPVRLGEALSQ